ncbi:unnamed protein product [Adineta steineri]|uniref:ubiquitinyl hydrolase 1 n=1 Tax=Adineta steineri TaxID=433720 RepID=A0A818X7X7_9BILA|nr:unnamed protein product [Adineta steineri]
MWLLLNILFELILYLIIDNITKFVLIHNKNRNRFDILIYECMFLGFCIGFISIYSHITYVLICFLLIHIIGTLYTEKQFNLTKKGFQTLINISIDICRLIINRLYNLISKYFIHRSPSKVLITKKLPEKYLYNYHVKPTDALRLQQPQTLSRCGLSNLHGATYALNPLLQSLASLNSFYPSLQKNINLSRSTYDSIVPTFINLISQLRNNHHLSEYKHWNTLIDTSSFISKLNTIYPQLLTKRTTIDIGELFQCIIDVLSNALSKQSSICSTNVIEQVQNRKLTTLSLDHLNKIFVETEAQLYNKITLDNLDAQSSYIIQYIDLTWLLHHVQLDSIIKQTFSGQMLHAYCCNNCSHVRFRTEPFQILTLPVNTRDTTLERIISQLTKIEMTDSISCTYCSSQSPNNYERESKSIKHGTLLTKIASTLSPMVTTSSQSSSQILSSTSIPRMYYPNMSTPTTIIPSITNHNHSRIKSQTMIANFPNILCIKLKRFSSSDRLSQNITKLKTNILIEPQKILDLSNIHYTTWLGLTNFSLINSSRYQLVAACLHLSRNFSSLDGHYVCLYRTNNSQWFLSDNERITEINQIDNIFQTPYVTENCYLLFYERCL